MAQNETVNVPMPPTMNNVPLRSVNGWLTIMSRIDASFPIDLTWNEYKVGFGDIETNFWLGLERIHQLAISKPYRLRFEVQYDNTFE